MIRQRFKEILEEQNKTLTQVYLDTGVSAETLIFLYDGNNPTIDLKTLDLICNYLKVTPNEFLGFEFGINPSDDNLFSQQYEHILWVPHEKKDFIKGRPGMYIVTNATNRMEGAKDVYIFFDIDFDWHRNNLPNDVSNDIVESVVEAQRAYRMSKDK